MVVRSNIWGGRFDIATEEKEEEEDDNYDRASYKAPKNEEVKQGWLLKPPTEVEMIRKRKKKRCNMDPPLIMKNLVVVAILVAVAALIALLVSRSHQLRPSNVQENYTIVLHAALKFFNAQKSGRLPPNNNVSWRGDSCLNDGNGYLKGLEGGYYDGGDAVKYSFPTSFAMTLLSWSVLEYSARYEAAGELDHVKDIIRWGTNYLLKTFDSTGKTVNEVASQVGQTSKGKTNDGNCWIRPERIDYARRVIRCPGSCPALAAEMAAALAAASIVFKDDNHYSQLLVHGATMLYNFATNGEGQKYSGGPDPPSQFYNSSGFWDEFVWGGAWLYCATGRSSYLDFVSIPDLAKAAGAFQGGPDYGVFSWDNKLAGAQLLLSRMRLFLDYGYPYEGMLKNFHEQISYTLCSYLPDFHNFNRTSGGLIQLNHGQPRPLQYAVNAAFLAVLYSDYLEAILIPGWTCGSKFYNRETLRHFAMTQINYILGRNPQNMSYVVGFGHHFPKHVHHKGASVPRNIKNENCQEGLQWRDSKKPNPNTIVGGMVSGPDKFDGFQDNRANFNYTEPTISGNAGLVAALVALLDGSRAGIDKNSIFYAIPPFYPPPPPPPDR